MSVFHTTRGFSKLPSVGGVLRPLKLTAHRHLPNPLGAELGFQLTLVWFCSTAPSQLRLRGVLWFRSFYLKKTKTSNKTDECNMCSHRWRRKQERSPGVYTQVHCDCFCTSGIWCQIFHVIKFLLGSFKIECFYQEVFVWSLYQEKILI